MKNYGLFSLNATSEKCSGAIVLTVEGDVDLATASTLAQHLDNAISVQPSAVVVDLSGVDFLASVGMSVLIAAREKAHHVGSILVVVADGPTTRRPMELVGLDVAIPLFTDLDSAVNAATGADIRLLSATMRSTSENSAAEEEIA